MSTTSFHHNDYIVKSTLNIFDIVKVTLQCQKVLLMIYKSLGAVSVGVSCGALLKNTPTLHIK